jgi:transcriptional regulator with XRE-family HTH domain
MARPITGEQLRVARTRSRLHNKELARLLGVSTRTLDNWLDAGVPARSEDAVHLKLADYLEDDEPLAGRPLAAYSDVELLAEVWQRMDAYRQAAEHTPKGVVSARTVEIEHRSDIVSEATPPPRVRSGDAGERPQPRRRPDPE